MQGLRLGRQNAASSVQPLTSRDTVCHSDAASSGHGHSAAAAGTCAFLRESLWRTCAVLQIVVAPPYDTCTSLHNDEAAAMRVKKVVSQQAESGTCSGCAAQSSFIPQFVFWCSGFSDLPYCLCPCTVQLDAERLRLQAG